MNTNNKLVAGSLAAVSREQNRSLAEGFLNVKAFVMVDVSASMAINDAGDGKSRYVAACDELARLQTEVPGEIGVGAFSDRAEFSPGGVPVFLNGGTMFAAALRMMKLADNCGIRLVLISDGEPQDPTVAMSIAATFHSRIDTIFVGPETGRGREFLRQLSVATGGVSIVNRTEQLNLLGDNVRRLLQ